MKVMYSPACSHSTHLCYSYPNGKTSAWWRPTDMMNHSSLLVSYFYAQREPELRKKLQLPDDFILIGDSGGFQNVTQNADLRPLDVLRWQEANCEIGLILDHPPYDFSGSAQLGGESVDLFRKGLDITKNNIRSIVGKRQNTKMKLYGVIQGDTQEQREMWYKEVNELMEFDGWALSPKPASNPFQVAAYLLTAYEKGFKNIHILQVSGYRGLAAIYYFTKYFKGDLITFDSSSFIRFGSESRRMQAGVFGDKFIRVGKVKEKVCDCKVCRNFPDISQFQQPDGKGGFLLSLHNLNMKLQECKVYKELIENDEEDFINSLGKDLRTRKVFEFIDNGIKNGVRDSITKFREYIKEKNVKQKTIFGSI